MLPWNRSRIHRDFISRASRSGRENVAVGGPPGNRRITGGDIQALLKIALPSMVATMAATAMSFVDFAFVSTLGSAAQAAVGNASVLVWTFLGLGTGIVSVMSTFASQALGQGKPREGAAYMWQSIYLSAAFGAVGLLLVPLMPLIYAGLGHPAEILHLEVVYSQILLLASLPAIAAAAVSNYFNGIHRPKVTMTSMIVANLLNALLDYLLVFGHWGFPALGVAGAACATLASLTFRTVWLILAMTPRRFRREFEPFAYWRYSGTQMWNLLKVGSPLGLQWVADIGTWALFSNWLISRFGTGDIAATQICWKLLELSWMPAIGMGIGISAVVGKAIGQGKIGLAQRRARLGMMLSLAYTAFMGALFVALRYPLIGLFAHDAYVLGLGANLMLLAATFQIFDGLSTSIGSALSGAGDTKWQALVLAAYSYGIVVVGGWLVTVLLPGLGSYGPWIMCTIYAILLSLTLRRRWVRGQWKTIDIFAAGTADEEPDEAGEMTPAAGEANVGYARLQENGFDTEDEVPDEGELAPAGAGLAEALGRDGSVRPDSQGAPGKASVPPARRAAVRQRRHPHGTPHQQGAQGHRGAPQDDGGLRQPVRPRVGLPRAPDRT